MSSSSSASSATSTLIDLSLARPSRTPVESLTELADACNVLHIRTADVYGDFGAEPSSSYLRHFEWEIAEDLGKEDALWIPSGVMAQQIALLIHHRQNQHPQAFIAPYSSHLFLHEHNSYTELLQFQGLSTGLPDPTKEEQLPVNYNDIVNTLLPFSSSAPTASTVILEIPHREIGGKLTTYDDLIHISQLCRKHNVALHMDGARLWESSSVYAYFSDEENVKDFNSQSTTADGKIAVDQPLSNSLPSSIPTPTKTRKDICALFDSIYVSFYKGLGGLSGSMLVGGKEFIAEARIWLRRFGGNLYTSLPYSVSGYLGYRKYANDFSFRADHMRKVVKLLTDTFIFPTINGSNDTRVQKYTTPTHRPILRFDPPVPRVSLIHVYLRCSVEIGRQALVQVVEEQGIQCFVPSRLRPGLYGASGQCYFEMNMGPENMKIPLELWIKGWKALLENIYTLLHKNG